MSHAKQGANVVLVGETLVRDVDDAGTLAALEQTGTYIDQVMATLGQAQMQRADAKAPTPTTSKSGDPYGNRTRVSAVRGPRPNR